MAIQEVLFHNLIVAASRVEYSRAVDIGPNSVVLVSVATIYGPKALDTTTTRLEGSTDLSNWTIVGGMFSPGFSSGPHFTSLTVSGVGARYVRLKVATGIDAVCINASLTATAG